MDWVHKASSAYWFNNVKKDIEELAKYFHDQVVKAFKEDSKQRFKIIEYIGQQVQPALRLELALIEINPSTPVLHATGLLQPGAGSAAGMINPVASGIRSSFARPANQ